MRVAVAGGTGVIGRLVVQELDSLGHDSVTLSRSVGVDLMTGEGVDAALSSVDSVIDVTSVLTTKRNEAITFFTNVTKNLQDAEFRQGVKHHVALSIVGIDQLPVGYYAGKSSQERAVAGGAIPWTILRTTQFHECAVQMLERGTMGPVTFVPTMATQPVAAREVATDLIDIAIQSPVGRALDLVGPRYEHMADMVRRLVETRGDRRVVVPLHLPGGGWKAVREGALRPNGDVKVGTQTFDGWLATDGARGRR